MEFKWPGKYTFVDVEIPNINNDCICAVSMIVVEDQKIVLKHTELIHPKSFFSGINISIHHITPHDVSNKRSFREFWNQYGNYFSSEYIIIGHNVLSDINVMNRDLERWGMQFMPGFYIDTVDLALHEFYHDQVDKGDLKLNHICQKMGIPISHHDPKSDVNACLEIIEYLEKHGFNDLHSYIKEVHLKYNGRKQDKTLVKNLKRKKQLQDIRSRDFTPYFYSKDAENLSYSPYFDWISLQDLMSVSFLQEDLKENPLAMEEKKQIENFIKRIRGKIYPLKEIEQAGSLIEFNIPHANSFIRYKQKGKKLFHSIYALDFIRKVENNSFKQASAFKYFAQARLTALQAYKDKTIDTNYASREGQKAFEKNQDILTVYFYELAVLRGTSNIRIYRQLSEIYRKYKLSEEEKRVLIKGIRNLKRRKKKTDDLVKLLRLSEQNEKGESK